VIPGGGSLALPDDEAAVIANLGGVDAVVDLFDVRPGLASQQAEADANAYTLGASRPQTIASAGQQIQAKGMVVDLNPTSNLVLNATPTIPAGRDSQVVILINCAIFTVTLQDGGTLPGSGLKLGAATRVLAQGDNITLMYHPDLNAYVETAFTNVVPLV